MWDQFSKVGADMAKVWTLDKIVNMTMIMRWRQPWELAWKALE